MDSAVGYFNLRGWRLFADAVDAKDQPADGCIARVLVGMTTADPDDRVHFYLQEQLEGGQGETDIDRELARARREHALMRFRTQLMRGIPNRRDLATLRTLREQLLAGKVQIRLFTRRPLHGKTYICYRQDLNNPITAFVGSSNLTMSGLRHNYELNVDVVDSDATQKLEGWFKERWEDTFCIDISSDLIELIDQSWASKSAPTPYEVYLKVCYHLSRDVREGMVEFALPEDIARQLLEYQARAVKTLARRVVNRGGAMLGDVVGLGKTITAVAVALMLRDDPHNYSTLVVCPKNLVGMWEAYLDAYEVDGRVIPFSLTARKLPELRRYQFVIVDESHTMRSDKRMDYVALHNYIRTNNCKVLLLTATPFNIRFKDVANQLSLYLDDDTDLGIQPVHALQADPNLVDKVDGKISTLAAFKRSEEPEDWKRLMSDHLVRRTRSFIRTNYAEVGADGRECLRFASGETFAFPDRVALPLDHSFGADDPAVKMASDATLDAIEGLHLPRYDLASYLRGDADQDEKNKEVVERLQRASGHLLGFIRTGLYKRLSSGGYSFIISLKRHLLRNRLAEWAYENGEPLPVGPALDPGSMGETSDSEEFPFETGVSADVSMGGKEYYLLTKEHAPASTRWIDSSLFEKEFGEHLRTDSAVVEELLRKFGTWNDALDSKLDRLFDLVTKDHGDEKILVFTEYKDTANYVAAALERRGVEAVAAVSGDTADPTALAKRFSPLSNVLPGEQADNPAPSEEIRVLVATDVLSEGQNLQDAHIVVNYDLPWAIIKLIQRAGRVDRVGQRSPHVFVYSFFHEDVEAVLSLRKRIRERLQNNAEVFGSDERFFGSDEEIASIVDLYNGNLREEESGEVDASSLAFEAWRQAEKDHPEVTDRVLAMPDMVFSTKSREGQEATGVACFVRTEKGVDGFGFAPDAAGSEIRLLTAHEALQVFLASVTTPNGVTRSDHFDLLASLVQGPLSRPVLMEGRLRGVRKRTWERLANTFGSANEEVAMALEALFRSPLTTEAERRLSIALSRKDSDEQIGDLIALLDRESRLVLPDRPEDDPVRIVTSLGITT